MILCVGPSVLARPYRGILKKEDIKSTDKDRIDPYKCFRPGDVILARVVSFKTIFYTFILFMTCFRSRLMLLVFFTLK